jgi:hypothetical protein
MQSRTMIRKWNQKQLYTRVTDSPNITRDLYTRVTDSPNITRDTTVKVILVARPLTKPGLQSFARVNKVYSEAETVTILKHCFASK